MIWQFRYFLLDYQLFSQAKTTFDNYVQGTDLRVGILGGVETSLDYYDDESFLSMLFVI